VLSFQGIRVFYRRILLTVFLLVMVLPTTSAVAQVQLGARPDDTSVNELNQPLPIYNLPIPNAPSRRREAGFVLDDHTGSGVRGVSRGINRGINRGTNRGINRGVNRGINRGLSRGMSRGINRGEDSGAGIEDAEPLALPRIIAPLAPLSTGFSSTAQPELFWYLSDPWPGTLHFTLNAIGAIEPLLELQIKPPKGKSAHSAGMHSINLVDHAIRLAQNTEYEWFIFIITDPLERSADFLASATIVHKIPDSKQANEIATVPKTPRYINYAAQGFWYDAMAILSNEINQNPHQQELRKHRASLIEQVKMPKVADFDKAMYSNGMADKKGG